MFLSDPATNTNTSSKASAHWRTLSILASDAAARPTPGYGHRTSSLVLRGSSPLSTIHTSDDVAAAISGGILE